jgi:excisionase family DNA binding protein
MNITFEQMPNAINELQESVKNIERILLNKSNENKTKEEEFLTVKETAEFLSLSVPTIYGLIHKGEIPVMKRSKRCYFSKIELINYLKLGKRKTLNEIEKEADRFISQKKGGKTC